MSGTLLVQQTRKGGALMKGVRLLWRAGAYRPRPSRLRPYPTREEGQKGRPNL